MTAYDDLAARIGEYHDLLCALNTLKWDMRTMMPARGAASRGRQLATLTAQAKSIFVSEKTARLLDAAEAEVAGEDADSYRVRAVRQVRDAYEIHRRIPSELVARMAALGAQSEAAWAKAKDDDDFAGFKPWLKRMLALNIELAEAIGYSDHPFDALIRQFEPGMTSARLGRIFAELKAGILPLLQRIAAVDAPLPLNLWEAEYDLAAQKGLCLELTALIGFDYERGRLDTAPHPFEISFTRDDVRITTRYDANYLPMSLFAALHEAGHGLYEQNIAPELTRTALTADFIGQYAVGGASFGAHEFSSRLWENQIGRSRDFWRLHFSRLQEAFPAQLAAADAELFYRAVNRVRPSLIRVEADEVTYNLHIMLRAEIEMALLEGAIAVDDLPEIWNAKMEAYLGLTPPDDRRGVLQDVHWSFGGFGNFPCYTIGNIMAAQVLAAARAQMPALAATLAAGDYQALQNWLSEHIYRHGRAYSTDELLTRISGEGLNTAPLLDYLEEKYSDLYGLN
ncbi:MAG: carboxypeptidase M32 [Chloroflexota bacterium]|nr:carboxypeptidase M32 [Chloroflexota bacterium]